MTVVPEKSNYSKPEGRKNILNLVVYAKKKSNYISDQNVN